MRKICFKNSKFIYVHIYMHNNIILVDIVQIQKDLLKDLLYLEQR